MKIFDKMIEDLKRSQGIEAVSDPVLIEERKEGIQTYRFEIQPESYNGKPALRFMVTEFAGMAKSGRYRKSFTWPVQTTPTGDLKYICDTILASIEPGAEIVDPRSWFGRTFDNLTGGHHLNYIPVLLEDKTQEKRHWLRARIRKDRNQGSLVTLTEEYEKRNPIWMRIPVETIRVLQQKLETDEELSP